MLQIIMFKVQQTFFTIYFTRKAFRGKRRLNFRNGEIQLVMGHFGRGWRRNFVIVEGEHNWEVCGLLGIKEEVREKVFLDEGNWGMVSFYV